MMLGVDQWTKADALDIRVDLPNLQGLKWCEMLKGTVHNSPDLIVKQWPVNSR